KKRRGNLPKHVTAILKSWLANHVKHPYPTEDEKIALAMETKLTMNQISNWFINARRRILQSM
ncbi:homeobox domain of homeobox protein Pknox1, partial [Basidiobolus meristosporus CBS 931.73]